MIKPGNSVFGKSVVNVASRPARPGERGDTWNLAILVHDDKITPFIVCEFVEGDAEWWQGDYYHTIDEALDRFHTRGKRRGYLTRRYGLTEPQTEALTRVCERYGAKFYAHHFVSRWDIPEGWVAGWVKGPNSQIYIACDPEGQTHS